MTIVYTEVAMTDVSPAGTTGWQAINLNSGFGVSLVQLMILFATTLLLLPTLLVPVLVEVVGDT